jgi:hypothetical protein
VVASARRPWRVRRVASAIAAIWRAFTAVSLLCCLLVCWQDGSYVAGPAVRAAVVITVTEA